MFIFIKNKGATRTAGHFLGSAQKLFQYSLIFIIQKLRREDNKKFIHLREGKKVFVEKYEKISSKPLQIKLMFVIVTNNKQANSMALAVPMYANAAGIVPIIEVFVAKGIPLGTAIAFMMAIIGLSIPEATKLKKVMTWRLTDIFFSVVTLLIIVSGYLFNWIL